MMGFVLFIHCAMCLLLIVIILMQSGRGGGLTESFASAESMFGAQTDSFLTRTTTIFAIVFFLTCLSLAVLSSKRDQSLMAGTVPVQTEQTQVDLTPSDIVKEVEVNTSEPLQDQK